MRWPGRVSLQPAGTILFLLEKCLEHRQGQRPCWKKKGRERDVRTRCPHSKIATLTPMGSLDPEAPRTEIANLKPMAAAQSKIANLKPMAPRELQGEKSWN